MGQVETSLSGNALDISGFLDSVSIAHPQTAQGWQLSALYSHYLAGTSRFKLRAGVLHWRSDYTLSTATTHCTVDASGYSQSFGVGLDAELTLGTRIGGNYDRYSIDDEDIYVVSVGLTFSMK